jgi:hypothetical protein
VLFTGDVVMSQRFLAAQNNSSLKTWLSVLDELAALKPLHVVPSHGKLGDATLVARDRDFIQAVQARAGALKREGKSIDEAVATVVAEIAPRYPEFGNPTNAGAMARAAYASAVADHHRRRVPILGKAAPRRRFPAQAGRSAASFLLFDEIVCEHSLRCWPAS